MPVNDHTQDGDGDGSRPTPRTIRGYRRHVVVLTLALFTLCVAWAATMPYLHGPDEAYHHNSVARVARGGGWPLPYESPLLAATFVAVEESGAYGFGLDPLPRLPSPTDRSSFSDPGHHQERSVDRMLQHPPGYYVLTAAPVKALGVDRLRWDQAAMIMRIVSAAILALALPFIIGTVSRLTRNQLAGLVGGTAIVGIPFFSTVGGYVSNDTLLVTAGAAATYGAVRLAVEPDAPRWMPAATGAALGIALLSKGYALLTVPVVVAFALLAVRRQPRPRRPALVGRLAVGGLVAMALGGWWWVRNLIVLGKIQPSRLERYGSDDPTHPRYSFGRFLETATVRIHKTFWGRGARPGLAFPETLTAIATVLLLLLVVLGLVRARRRLDTALLLAIPVLLAATFLANAHRIYRVVLDTEGGIRGVQGRYLYSGLVGVAVCIGWAALALRRRIPPSAIRWIAPIVLVLPWASALGGLRWTILRDRGARRMARLSEDVHDWIGVPLAWVLPAICLALVLWTAVSVARDLRTPPATAPIEPDVSPATPTP